jgi:hypothetical protein
MCFWALLLSTVARAQVYLNYVYPQVRSSGILLEADGGYITNGWHVTPGTVTTWHRDLVLYKLNSNGAKMDSLVVFNSYTDGFSAYSGSLKRLSNGDILQIGLVGDNGNIDSAFGAVVYRIHSDLSDSIWTKKYQYNDLHWTINLDALEMGNGNIVVAGLYYHSYSTSLYEYIVRGWLYMLDSLGNRLWEKSFNFPTSNAGGSLREIKRAHDGGFIIGALSSAGRTHPAIPNWNSGDGWVIKTDSLGNEQWRHKMTTGSQWYDSEPIIVPTSDGNYVVGQVMLYEEYNGQGLAEKGHFHVKKLNSSGNVIWDKRFGDTIPEFYYNNRPYYPTHFTPKEGVELSDGAFVFAGSNYCQSKVFKISQSGDSLWNRYVNVRLGNFSDSVFYRCRDRERLEDFKLLPSGGFIGAGQYEADFGGLVYPNGAQLNWIVQLDEWGCDSLGCQYISVPEPPQPQAGSYAMRIWPNPATNHLHIELPTHQMGMLITIRNSPGQSVHQSFYNSTQPIDISYLAPGHYIVESGLPGEVFGYAKLVKL